jgi:hypothetical protein
MMICNANKSWYHSAGGTPFDFKLCIKAHRCTTWAIHRISLNKGVAETLELPNNLIIICTPEKNA